MARYLAIVPLAALAFTGLAVIQERDLFLPAWRGAGRPIAARPAGATDAARVEAGVRALAALVEAAYRAGDPAPLDDGRIAPAVREALAADVAFTRARGDAPLVLASLRVLEVTPHPDGLDALVEEAWSPAGGVVTRGRWRYHIRNGEPPRIEEMTFVPSEGSSGARR